MGLNKRRLARHASDLQLLARAKKVVRNKKIKTAPKDLILALVDVARAIIKGEISLSPTQLGAVRRHKNTLKKVTKPRATVKTLRRTFQTGGLLPAILGPVLKIAAPLIGGLLGSLGGGNAGG